VDKNWVIVDWTHHK